MFDTISCYIAHVYTDTKPHNVSSYRSIQAGTNLEYISPICRRSSRRIRGRTGHTDRTGASQGRFHLLLSCSTPSSLHPRTNRAGKQPLFQWRRSGITVTDSPSCGQAYKELVRDMQTEMGFLPEVASSERTRKMAKQIMSALPHCLRRQLSTTDTLSRH